MDKPQVAATIPVAVELEAGKNYFFCTCGRSSQQPFCDGSHQGTDFKPQKFTIEEDGEKWLCQCKQSNNQPYCDGSHNQLEARQEATTERRWHKVAELGEMEDGESRPVTAGSIDIALTYLGGNYGAISNRCPHQGGPLGEGSLDDDQCLHCPWHGWSFNAFTGEGPEGDAVPVYPVEAREDGVYVQVEESQEETTTVSDIVAHTLVNWGITHVFGMVGHSNLGLAEALRKLEASGAIQFIGIRHEGAAAFACSGYAKASGRPAACLTIAGPGATNLLTGIWDAKVDRHPLLALTGQVETQVLGPGAFQEVDLASAFEAATQWSRTVLHDSDHAELANLAMKNALVERGPSHLIFPDEVQVLEAGDDAGPGGPDGRLADTAIAPSEDAIEQAAALLAGHQRPTIVVGYGAQADMPAIIALAEQIGAPILTTFKAKGYLADDHPLAGGVLGRSGTPVAARLMAESDMLLVLGASFSRHTGIDSHLPTVQVDLDRMTLGKFHPVTVPVWADIGLAAGALQARSQGGQWQDRRDRVAALRAEWQEEKARRRTKDRGRGLASAVIFDVLSELIPEDAVIAVDVGNNTYSFGRYFECSGRQKVLMSGYLGSIGFGFPAAMGAWAACPDRPIVCISGDGGFGQYMAELTTAVKYGMNITHVLLNNSELGKISKEQRAGHWEVWQTALHNPSFAEYARLCGAFGIRVEEAEGIAAALTDALAYAGPSLVELISDSELV